MSGDCLRSEYLVIGGGLAGSMAAMRLAQAGRAVALVEKEQVAHHKVCGEFLSPEAVAYLGQAGVDPMRLGAVQIRVLRIAKGNWCIETQLPFTALSLSRNVLDEALLQRAVEVGCAVRRGLAVERLAREGRQWCAGLADGSRLRADCAFLATGKHDLRGWSREPGVQNDLVGFKMHWHLAPEQVVALRGCMEMFFFRGGYGGLSLVEGDAANLCLVARSAVLRTVGGWPGLLESICAQNRPLRGRLEGAQTAWQRPLAVSRIPYGYCAHGLAAPDQDGLWRIGDQAAVIPSFTGDGMAIALHSGALAAEMALAGASAEMYQHRLGAQLKRGMSLATLISRAMVRPAAQQLAPPVLWAFPRIMQWIAASTRIPARELLSTRAEQPC